jgi:hypothetical protein
MDVEVRQAGDGPHWPASEAQAIAWLRQRGGAADQRLDDRKTLVDAVLAWRMLGPGVAATVLVDALGDLRTVRGARTDRERLGSYHSDSTPLQLRRLATEPLGRGAIVVLLSAALAAIVAPPTVMAWVQIVLVAIGLACVGRPQIGPTVILALSYAVAIAARPATWWECGYTLFAGWCLVHYVGLLRLTAGPWWTRGPLLGFIPWQTRLLLRLTGRATVLGVAVDLATSSRAAAAAPFVTACRRMPKIIEPIVEMCAALVAADDGQVQAALTGAAHAVDASRSGPRTLHGWCLAQLATVLQKSGSAHAASQRQAAMDLLTSRSCRRIHRELQLSQVRYQLTDWPRRHAIALVHHHRVQALRRHDYDMLHLTEMWLIQLMLAVGNNTGAEFLLLRLVGGSDGRTAMHAPRDETPEHLLMRAGVLVAGSPDQREIAIIRRDVHVALAMLDAQRRPLAATAAYLLLAKLDHAAGQTETALAHAGYSLAAAQHGRYMLPTPRWRRAWDLMQLDAHATALMYAAEGTDSALVAEIIELARGEVLPESGQPSMLTPLAGLEAGWDARALPATPGPTRPLSDSASSLLAFQGLNPVRQPPRVRIGPSLRLEPLAPASDDIDVEAALQATAPRAWYWTGVTVIDQYYWAVRSPDGQWSHGCTSMAPGTEAAAAYAALGRALPFGVPGEDAKAVSQRVSEGPLGRPADHSREQRLLREVAWAFLPSPLAEGLRSEPVPVRLVVSLPAALGHLPVAGLPIGDISDLRVVEKASVVHVPSWSVSIAARAAMSGRSGRAPARLAVFAPSGGTDLTDLARLASPRGVERTVAGPLSGARLRNSVHAVSADRDWLLTIIGHVDHNQDKPTESGLRLDGGYLTLADLVGADPAQRLTIPERVLLIGCGSIGFASPAPEPRLTPTSEWLGLGAAVVLAGAADVCCTLYTVYANAQMARIVDGLVEGMSSVTSAPEALRQVQLSELNRWRTIGDNYPLQWLALAYVGTGWDR